MFEIIWMSICDQQHRQIDRSKVGVGIFNYACKLSKMKVKLK